MPNCGSFSLKPQCVLRDGYRLTLDSKWEPRPGMVGWVVTYPSVSVSLSVMVTVAGDRRRLRRGSTGLGSIVVLLRNDGANHLGQGVAVGTDAAHVGAPASLPVEPQVRPTKLSSSAEGNSYGVARPNFSEPVPHGIPRSSSVGAVPCPSRFGCGDGHSACARRALEGVGGRRVGPAAVAGQEQQPVVHPTGGATRMITYPATPWAGGDPHRSGASLRAAAR